MTLLGAEVHGGGVAELPDGGAESRDAVPGFLAFAWLVAEAGAQACVASRKPPEAGRSVDRGRHPGDRGPMDLTDAARAWNEDGLVILPALRYPNLDLTPWRAGG